MNFVDKKVSVSFSIDLLTLGLLHELIKKEDTTMSQMMRKIIVSYHKKTNSPDKNKYHITQEDINR